MHEQVGRAINAKPGTNITYLLAFTVGKILANVLGSMSIISLMIFQGKFLKEVGMPFACR